MATVKTKIMKIKKSETPVFCRKQPKVERKFSFSGPVFRSVLPELTSQASSWDWKERATSTEDDSFKNASYRFAELVIH